MGIVILITQETRVEQPLELVADAPLPVSPDVRGARSGDNRDSVVSLQGCAPFAERGSQREAHVTS